MSLGNAGTLHRVRSANKLAELTVIAGFNGQGIASLFGHGISGLLHFYQDVIIPYYVMAITSAAQFSCGSERNPRFRQGETSVSVDGKQRRGARENRRRTVATG